MRRTHTILGIGILAFVLALPAAAQPPGGGERGQGRGGQRGGFGPGQGFGGRGGFNVGMVARQLARELALDEEQQAEYDEILASFRERMSETRGGGREQMRELTEQMRAAREAGDEETVARLREQMRQRGGGPDGQLVEDFFAEVESILDDAQVEKLHAFRAQVRERMERGRQQMELQRLMRTLPDDLGLDEEQREEYRALLDERRERRGSMRERWQQMQPLMEELRAAREAGDEDRVAELEAQIEAQRPQPPDAEEFFQALEEFLTAEQKAKLADLRQRVAGPPAPEAAGPDVRTLLRAARRLDLNRDQAEKLRGILRDAEQAQREAGRDRQAAAALPRLVKQQIVALLTPEQVTEFEAILKQHQGERVREDARPGQRGERAPRGAPGTRGGGGGGGAGDDNAGGTGGRGGRGGR